MIKEFFHFIVTYFLTFRIFKKRHLKNIKNIIFGVMWFTIYTLFFLFI